jgi:hypothetical protein
MPNYLKRPMERTEELFVLVMYFKKGRWQVAEELAVQVLETSKKMLGGEHPNTLIKGGRGAAGEMLEARKRVLRAEHPYRLDSMDNRAFTCKGQDRDTETLNLIEECAQLRIRLLGVNHSDTDSSSAALSQ